MKGIYRLDTESARPLRSVRGVALVGSRVAQSFVPFTSAKVASYLHARVSLAASAVSLRSRFAASSLAQVLLRLPKDHRQHPSALAAGEAESTSEAIHVPERSR